MTSGGERRPKVWGRRPYAGKSARELLNDVSAHIARTRPADVDDPDDPTLSDVLRHAGPALSEGRGDDDPKGTTLTRLLKQGLNYQEAVVWYQFRYCRLDITEIHFACEGRDTGGDVAQRRQSTRNILRVLSSAASKMPGASEDDVPSMADDRRRHDRSDVDPDDTDT